MKKLYGSIAILIILSTLITACGTRTTSIAFCGYVVDNVTLKVKKIIYPGESEPTLALDENLYTVPCNSRNYKVNDGSRKHLDGTPIGDSGQLITARTADGTPVLVSVDSYWTLNQSDEAMRLFWSWCQKYKCYNQNSNLSDDANFSSTGWNGMLGENYLPAVMYAVKMAVGQMHDDVIENVNKYEEVTNLMPDFFNTTIRITHGFSEIDIICGSGDSYWEDENNRGPNGKFECSKVRFQIEDIVLDMEKLKDTNSMYLEKQQLQQAIDRYGEEYARCWLAVQDTVKACSDSGATCIINFSPNMCTGTPNGSETNPPLILLPTNSPAAESGTVPAPTATP